MNTNDVKLSPLADPVVGAIFANAEVSGLAAASLIRVILDAEGEGIVIGKVISVTPQRSYIDAVNRGCRVDIEIITDKNEYIIFEVQIKTDYEIMQRNLFSAAQIISHTAAKGTTSHEMAAAMPRVITINILNYNIRNDNPDILQPFKILYTKPPQRVAVPQLSGYDIQLPRLAEMEPDFNNGLYCWFYTLLTAHQEGKTIEEVLTVTPELEAYAKEDTGYRQFCEQYKLAASDPETQDEYFKWRKALMAYYGPINTARNMGMEEGIEKGMEKGITIGMTKAKIEAAINTIQQFNIPVTKVMRAIQIPETETQAIVEKLQAANITFEL